jgi:hypothetical protein
LQHKKIENKKNEKEWLLKKRMILNEREQKNNLKKGEKTYYRKRVWVYTRKKHCNRKKKWGC